MQLRRSLARFLLVVMVMGFASAARADETFTDDFTDPAMSPYWSPLIVGTGPTMVETGGPGGNLQLTIPTTATGTHIALGYFTSCVLSGDFTVEATYSLPTYPTDVDRNRSISIRPVTLGGTILQGIARLYDPAIGEVYSGAKNSPVIWEPTSPPVTTGKLKLSRHGGMVDTWYADANTGNNWDPLDENTAYTTEDVRMAFWMIENPTASPTELMVGTFDDIVITIPNGSTFNCPFEGICGDTVPDPGETCDDGDEDGGDGCCACVQSPPAAADVSGYWQLSTTCANDVMSSVQEINVTQPTAGANAVTIDPSGNCGSVITGGQSTQLTTCAFPSHAAEFCDDRFSFVPTDHELTFPPLSTLTTECPTLARIDLAASTYTGTIAPDGSVAGTMAPSQVDLYNDLEVSPCLSVGGAFASCTFTMRRNGASPTAPTVQPLPNVSLTFDQLTEIVRVLVAPETTTTFGLPANFAVVGNLYYDIHTAGGTFPATAVNVCFDYADVPNPSDLWIGHASDDDFEFQILSTTLDTLNHRVCAVADGFSHFTVLAFADCGDGIVQYGEECDDGNAVDDDCCANACTANQQACEDDGDLCTEDVCAIGVCTHVVPTATCDQATSLRSSLTIKKLSDPANPKVTWKWLSYDGLDTGGLGTPDGGHDLGVCIYDGDGIVLSARVPAFGDCAGNACWQVDLTKGKIKYGSTDLAPDGIGKLQVTSVDTEQTTLGKLKVTGGGANLDLTDAGAAGLTLPVKARLVSSESDACWEGTFGVSGNVKLNNGVTFKAKSD